MACGNDSKGLFWGATFGFLLVSLQLAGAIPTSEYAVQLSAVAQTSPPRIVLSWPQNLDAVNIAVYRKLIDDTSWGGPIAVLTNTATSFTDTNVSIGSAFEYQVKILTDYFPYPNGNPSEWLNACGYCYAGIQAPLIETRGKIILLVDDRFSTSLAAELTRLQQDLVGDGWELLRHDVNSTSSVTSVKELIQSDYANDPANVCSVFLIGHLPVPYSGALNPDGHADHLGAWPADVYYADMNGNWSDSSVNISVAQFERNYNVPGDGKFDPSELPSDVELEIGRVDMANLPAFTTKSEEDLLRQYLDKDHNFRHGNLTVQRRGLVCDNFGDLAGEAPAASGWRNFSALFGPGATVTVGPGNFFSTLQSHSYLFAYGCGGGSYEDAAGVGSTSSFAANDPRAVFFMLFGSYFGDWDSQNNFLRAPLATTTYGLASVWAGYPHWFAQHMALGQTIGFGARLAQNNATNGLYHNKVNPAARGVHVALMGDPTLRLHPVRPPSGLTTAAPGTPSLTWTASPDSVLGYHVYRATNPTGPFTRLTAALSNSTSFIDTNAPFGVSTYMVRAVKLETSGSGTYLNPSEGVFLTINTIPASACMPGPLGILGWWPADGNALDIQGTNNGTRMNGTAYVSGKVGQAFNFDGVNDTVSIGPKFGNCINNFTMMFWGLPGAARFATSESETGTAGQFGQRYAIFPNYSQSAYGINGTAWGVSLGVNGVSIFECGKTIFPSLLVYDTSINNWTHITVVCSNGTPRLYLNGVLKRVGLTSDRDCHPSADLGGPTGFYSGAVDEVLVFNRVLSQSEIQSVVTAGSTGLCKQFSITDISRTSGQTLLTIQGRTGPLAIESSSNLLAWMPLNFITNVTGTVQYLDASGGASGGRFYRAALR